MKTHANWRMCSVILCALSGCREDGASAPESVPVSSAASAPALAPNGRYTVTAIGGLPPSNDAQGGAVCSRFSSRLLVKDRMSQAATVFNPNETIRFELLVTNNSGAPQTINASASCFTATFEVTAASGEKIWNNLSGVRCFVAEPPRTYAPFETVSYEVGWEQQSTAANDPPATPSELPECRAALIKSAIFDIR